MSFQANPRNFLTVIPDISPSTIQQDMFTFLQNSDEYDGTHDIAFKIGYKIFPAHRFICSACKMESLDLHIDSFDKVTIELCDIHPEIFNQLLLFIYTGICDLLVCQKCPENLENLKVITKSPSDKNKSSFNKNKDPVRLLQECAKQLGFRTLQKLLEDYYCNSGFIKCRSEKKYVPKMLKFDRQSHANLCDVIIKTKNDNELRAHKCILIARSEYFNNLFSLRWAESSSVHRISLPYSYTVVEHLLEYLYTDKLSTIENEDIENVCNLLILADEYFMERLKQICEYFLSTHITLKNVSQMFAFSYTYNAKQLSECCMEFICLNLSAVLESRCLDDIDEILLKDLSNFYAKWNPILQQRIITPYSTAPEDDVVLEIATKYPFVSNGEIKISKTVTKKKTKTHKSKPTTNISDSDKENIVKQEEYLYNEIDLVEDISKEKLRASPSTPVRIEAINSALKRIEMEPVVKNFSILPSVELESLEKFPQLGSSSTNGVYNNKPTKLHDCKSKIVKLSQKQRKRLSSESSAAAAQIEVLGIFKYINLLLCCDYIVVYRNSKKSLEIVQ